MNRSVKLIRNSAARLGNFGLGLVISFFMMPFLVKSLGDRMYGVWTLVGSVLGYYGLIDIGLSSAVVRFISRAVGRGEKDEIRTVFCTSFYLFLAMGLLTATLTWALTLWLGSIIHNPEDLQLFRWLLLILGFSFAFDFPVRAFNAIFTATIRDDISVGVSMVKSVIATAFIVQAVRHGHGVMALAVISVSTSVLDSLARVILAYRVEPAISIHPAHFDWSRVKLLFSYSSYSFVSRIGDLMQFRVDNLVITAYLGLGAVTHFFVAGRLVEYLKESFSQAIRGLAPMFSQEEGRSDFESIRRKFLYVTKLTAMLSVFVVGCAVAFGHPFIERWMGLRFLDSYPVLVVLCIGMLFRMAQLPTVPLLYGISKHKFHAYSTLVEGTANLVLSMALAPRYGILGVAFGTAIPMAFMTVFVQPWYVARVTKLRLPIYAGYMASSLAVCGAAFMLGWGVSRSFASPSYGALAAAGLLQAMVYWPLVLKFSLTPQERRHLFSSVRAALPFAERDSAAIAAEAGK